MVRTYKTMLTKRVERRHPCLVPDLRRSSFIFSPLRMLLALGLPYMAFITLRWFPSMPTFWSVFLSEMGSDCAKGFFCIYWKDHMVFILQFVNAVYHTDWFMVTENQLATACSSLIWDLSSQTRDWTWALEVKSLNPNHYTTRQLPHIYVFWCALVCT